MPLLVFTGRLFCTCVALCGALRGGQQTVHRKLAGLCGMSWRCS
jgi:hypothetical protein